MAQTKTTEQREVEQFATYIQKKGVNTRNKNAVIKAVDSFVAAESPFTSTAELKSMVSKLYDSGSFGRFENKSGMPSDSTRGAGFGEMDYDSAVAALGTFPKDRVPRLKDLIEKETNKTKTLGAAKANGKVDLLHELTVTNKMIAEGKMKPGFTKVPKTEGKVAAEIPSVLDYKGNKMPNVKELSAGGMGQKDIEIKAVAGSIAAVGSPTNSTSADQSAKAIVSEILNGEITNSIVKSILESPQYKKAFESVLQQTLPNDVAKAREILEQYAMDNPAPQDENEQASPTEKSLSQILNEVTPEDNKLIEDLTKTEYTGLKNPDALKIASADGKTTYYGGNQEWYKANSVTAYLGGCPPTAAANILLYMSQSDPELAQLYDKESITKEDFTNYMEDVYNYVKPLEIPYFKKLTDNAGVQKGIPTLGVFSLTAFTSGVEKFALSKGIELKANIGSLLTYNDLKDYIKEGLEKNCPIVLLNLFNLTNMSINKNADEEFNNHWVTITGMYENPKTGDVTLEVSTWGVKAKIDLRYLYKIHMRNSKSVSNSIKAVYFTKAD